MIKSFKNSETQCIFLGKVSPKYPIHIQETALRKMILIDAANSVEDLKIPPGNHLEKLSGNRTGQYSIRINIKYRICFEMQNDIVTNVEIVDYH